MSDSSSATKPGHGQFPHTRWSLVLEAQESDPAALSRLCGDYWLPLYGYACRLAGDPESAKDLTQGFFEHLLSKEGLRHARQDRGKLRSFLLTALKSYSISQWRRGQRLRRGGGQEILEMDAWSITDRAALEPRHELTPELEFDRAWARQLLGSVMTRLAALYKEAGKAELFEALRDRLEVRSQPVAYQEIASRLGLTEAALRMNAFKLRKRYRDLLVDTIADTVATPGEVGEELQYLMDVFARA